MSDAAPKKFSTRRYVLLAATVILVIGIVAFVASRVGLDKAMVRVALDRFAEEVAHSGQSKGKTIEFLYDDVKMVGGLLSRHANIINPRFVDRTDPQKIGMVHTSEVAVYPYNSALTSLRLELEKPLRVLNTDTLDATPLSTITQKTPILIEISPEGDNLLYVKQSLPEVLLVDGPEAERANPWNNFTIRMASGGFTEYTAELDPEQGPKPRKSIISLSNITLTPETKPEDVVTIETVDWNFTQEVGEDKRNSVVLNAAVGPVTGSETQLPYGPMEFSVALSMEGVEPGASPQTFAEVDSHESAFKLENLSLKSKNAALYATADFVSGAKDVLPVGTANITVENLPYILAELKKHEAITDLDIKLAGDLVGATTGKQMVDMKDVSIDIKRVRDGSFQIGNSTFEELMALLLKGALAKQPDAAKSVPGGPAPKAVAPAKPATKKAQ
jgi:hypothetical protein